LIVAVSLWMQKQKLKKKHGNQFLGMKRANITKYTKQANVNVSAKNKSTPFHEFPHGKSSGQQTEVSHRCFSHPR
jgi:hypothetical protein